MAIGVSVLFGFVLPGGLSGDSDYLALFFGGVAVGLGGGTFLAFVLGALLFLLAVTGACLD